MKVENIISNGISYNEPARNVAGGIITTAISLYRMRHSEEEIFDMFPEGDYHNGHRFNDDEIVATRICSAITKQTIDTHFPHSLGMNFEDHEVLLIEGIIKSFVDSLSGSEMDVIILDGMRDCAGADHWYTFEKDWN
tara:strand:- start:3 stop:413 length:411 start_codon:yes stop_codon:yes gene_type:complete